MGGRPLHFRLTGINNQNFLMRDEETGTWWQQINGKAIFGPLKGTALELAPYDELSLGLWKQEAPAGQVLAPVAKDESQYDSDWEPKIQKLPTVIDFPGTGLQSRDVVVGLQVGDSSRAYPVTSLSQGTPIQDRLNGAPILVVVGPDGKSVRTFVSQIDGQQLEFFRRTGNHDWLLVDSTSASEWNFQGCAISGPLRGKCLERLPSLKDYWFDWRNYHPSTTVYRH